MGGDWDLVTRVSVWGVGFGVVGARLYHDLTSWNEVPSPKWKAIFEVWQGGLGSWGGILLGTIAACGRRPTARGDSAYHGSWKRRPSSCMLPAGHEADRHWRDRALRGRRLRGRPA